MSLDSPIKTFSDSIAPVTLALPRLACDTHVHIFGPAERFPYADTRSFTPVDAPKETLFDLHRRLGIERCVIVQSMVHGRDNRVVVDAIEASGGLYLGVALVAPDTAVPALHALAAQGFRAVRFNFTAHLGTTIAPDALPEFTQRLAQADLHLQVHFDSTLIHALSPLLLRSAVPVVIDHIARVDATQGPDHADFQALCRLLDTGRFHVKVSGIDRVDAHGAHRTPPYSYGIALARHLVRQYPERCVWGTDWPHPNHTHIPDDGILVNALAHIAPTPESLQALMVDNPARLYRFN
jgi:2-pyrone-4,6-dicarboxylate lactonase